MTARAIAPAVSRLHQLAWRPGAEMHPAWWEYLGLAAWRDRYTYPACRASIDRLIVVRRGFPMAALPAQLDACQSALLTLEPRLDALMIALGLIAHGRPDYLLMQPYRALLAANIGEQGCVQLLALCHDRPIREQYIAPDRLLEATRDSGLRWWYTDAASCLVTRLLATVLPPPPLQLPAAPLDNLQGRASDWLIRIGRFL